MAEAKNRQLWDHTATLEAFIAAAISGERVDPRSLHPFYKTRGREPDIKLTGKQGIQLLRRLAGGGR